MDRRLMLLLLVAGTLALVTAAGSSAAHGRLVAAQSSSASKAAARGTLTIATEEDVRSADNILEGGTTTDKLMMESTVYDPLFTTGRETQLEPALALSAKVSKDLKTWTIALRHKVKFTDGKLFTSKDVKENFDAFMNPKNASSFAGDLANVASTQVVGPYGFRFNLKLPDARFPSVLEDTMYISDLDARASKQLLAPGEVPIGTGPYKWSSRTPGSSVTFVANDSYWRGKPPLGTVVFDVIPQAQSAVIALQKGDVDMIANYVPPQAIPALKSDPNIMLKASSGNTEYHAYMNMHKNYGNAHDVHLGLEYLMNTSVLIPKLIGDFGPVATQPIPRWQAGSDPKLKVYPYDPAKGQQLLALGGIPKGGTINLLAIQDRPFLCDWATAVQSNLKSLGYNAQLQCMPSAVLPTQTTKYQWDMLFYRNSGRATAGIDYQQRWGVAIAAAANDSYTLQDPALQAIIDKMNATVDPKKYAALGAQAADRIVLTDVADAPGYFDEAYFPIRKRVKGFVLSPLTWYGLLYNAINKVTVSGS
jgi:peptide/nickel transport system substrate-binding protein